MSTEKTYAQERDEAAEKSSKGLRNATHINLYRNGFCDGYDACKSRFEKIVAEKDDKINEIENWWKETCGDVDKLQKIITEKDAEIQKFKIYICESCYGIGEIGVPMPDGSYENRECDCYAVLKNPFIEKIASAHEMIGELKKALIDGTEGKGVFWREIAIEQLTEWEKANK